MIELALDRVLLASLIETEDLVAQVQPVGHEAESFVKPVAALDIVLRVGIGVLVAIRSLQAQHWIVGRESQRLSHAKEYRADITMSGP